MSEDSFEGLPVDIALPGRPWRENDLRSGSRSGVRLGMVEKR